MKKNIIPAFLLLLFYSCSLDQNDEFLSPQTRGFINLEVTEEHAEGNDFSDDIKTARFIVLTDLDSYPRTEVNEFKELTGSDRAAALKAVLEVSRKEQGPNDKLLVVIANEPSSMKDALDNVTTLQQLEELQLNMSSFVAQDHLSLQSNAKMPMSGAIWTSRSDVYATVDEAENHKILLLLDRAVARVDVYLNTNLTENLQIAAGSTVTLGNTYDRSYFVRHKNDSHVLGKIQTVESGFQSKIWTQTTVLLDVPHKTPPTPQTPSSVRLCTFYTPERNCLSDKLRIDVGIKIAGEDGFKSGGITLNTATDKNGVSHSVDVVQRNTVYKVTATIDANGITGEVQDWNDEEIITEL